MDTALDKHIEIDPAFRSGKPRLAGTRIAVMDVAVMHLRLGMSLEEIAGKYNLELGLVHAAMTYYYDHRLEIDRAIEEDREFAEAFRANNPSALQQKLRVLNRE